MSSNGDDALQGLLDRDAISALVFDYAYALDHRDWDLLRSCFTSDATADFGDFGGAHTGADAITAFVSGALAPLTATQHLTGNTRIQLAGDTATSTSYVHAQHVRAGTDGGENFTIGGTYRDTLVRTDGRWRFASRVLVAIWVEGNAAIFD